MKITCSKCESYLEPHKIGSAARYCNPCKNEWARGHRPKHSELSDDQKKKAVCRSYAGVYIRKGKIKKEPCSNCGNPEVQAHHEDYDKPLEVVWLCKDCHVELHTQRNRVMAASECK
jgi:ribosomal protein S27AE